MPKLTQEEIRERLRGLPVRKPRGSTWNILRALMTPLMLTGMSAEEAKAKVIKELQEVIDEAT